MIIVDHLSEQVLLVAEMAEQGDLIDSRLGGNRSRRCSCIPSPAEDLDGSLDDALSRLLRPCNGVCLGLRAARAPILNCNVLRMLLERPLLLLF